MTGEELLYLYKSAAAVGNSANEEVLRDTAIHKYVYGLSGLAQIFGCSIPTANRIKKSGKIDKAIKQIGRKIIVDVELALELAGRKTGGRR